jgi:hypothetical protein
MLVCLELWAYERIEVTFKKKAVELQQWIRTGEVCRLTCVLFGNIVNLY